MNPLHIPKPRTLFALAFVSLTFTGQANACSFNINNATGYFNCVKDEAYNKIVDNARRDAANIVASANSTAGDIRNQAKGVADSTLSTAYAAATKVKAAEPQLCE